MPPSGIVERTERRLEGVCELTLPSFRCFIFVGPVHAKQLLTYLRLMDLPLGLLMNFGADLFRNGLKRVINNRSSYAAPRVP